jgi:hypothetical protein
MAIFINSFGPRHISNIVYVRETALADDRGPVLRLVVVEAWNLLAVEVADITVGSVVSEDWGLRLLRIWEGVSQKLGVRATMLVAFNVLVPTGPRLVVVRVSISLLLPHAFSCVGLSHSIVWLAVYS